MPTDVILLIVTAVLAVVAVGAAIVSVRNLRLVRAELEASRANSSASEPETLEPLETVESAQVADVALVETTPTLHQNEQEVRIVDGKVMVTPTREQVANAVMGQARVRVAVWFAGLAHALRPESRDRIRGMMRRDYRDRRRHRNKAARNAARAAHSPSTGVERGTML